jgi:rubrerythrin
MLRVAQLLDAYAWVCDSCGIMNYVHPVIRHVTEEQLQEQFDTTTDEGIGAYVESPPSIVVCPHCKECFESVLIHEHGQDDDA